VHPRAPGGVRPDLPPLSDSQIDRSAYGPIVTSDATSILGYLFLGVPPDLPCHEAADVNDTRDVDLSDGVAILEYLSLGNRVPAPPFPSCGHDPTEDALTYEAYAPRS
jgi:hypothetical protein